MAKINWKNVLMCVIILGIPFSIVSCAMEVTKLGGHTKTSSDLEYTRELLKDLSKGALGDDRVSIEFRKDLPEYIKGTDVFFVMGRCNFSWSNMRFEVDINENRWYYQSSKRKLMLLAHEFGHCQCVNFTHTDKLMKDGCASHFMNGQLPQVMCINKHWNRYVKQMKEGC
jgi:hypothetical protein